ncbi:MAG TPA: thiamine phosphate synthase [Syntrophorhabdaceae bacterium]|nr:thiamine phosphate synthase [Syntrophorhabdaceae bacterium]
MKPVPSDYRLYLVTDSRLHKGYPVLEQVKLALEGGIRIIQLREKELPHEDFVREAREALNMTRSYNAFLIINDAVEVVREVQADGLHLGQEDVPLREARRLLGDDLIIGVSVKTAKQAIGAALNGADYVAVNGVFPTATKDDLGYLPGLIGVAEIRRSVNLPVIGIGGINLGNCRSVIEAGAHGVAVVTAVTMSDNIPGTCRTFLKIISACSCGRDAG